MRAAIFRSAQINTSAPPAMTFNTKNAATPAVTDHASHSGSPAVKIRKSAICQGSHADKTNRLNTGFSAGNPDREISHEVCTMASGITSTARNNRQKSTPFAAVASGSLRRCRAVGCAVGCSERCADHPCYLSISPITMSRLPTMAGTSAIRQPRQSSWTTDRLENELDRARTRHGIGEPSPTR